MKHSQHTATSLPILLGIQREAVGLPVKQFIFTPALRRSMKTCFPGAQALPPALASVLSMTNYDLNQE